jgi:hypothetical protein
MIDFNSNSIFKLKPIDNNEGRSSVNELLIDGEQIVAAFKGSRDSVIFTSIRIIAVNVQGMTGKKIDYSSLPYSRIQAFSIETAGSFDRDAELELWFSGLGKVKLEFAGQIDIKTLGNFISTKVFA